jgi:hypothetical protein
MSPSDGSRPLELRRHPHLYEINTWAWLGDLSEQNGKTVTLGTVPDAEWDELRELGFDLVWLMGVWSRSPAGRRIARTDPSYFRVYDGALPGWTMSDVVGSPYSIQDYSPDPRLGTWDEIDAVRRSLHARHMKLILDFVPNHTALDHPWINAHPEYYVQGTLMDFRRDPAAFFLSERADSTLFIARGKDPYFPPWADTAQLNYYNPATRDAMLGILGQLADHCDGARCDMAMLLLNDIFGRTWGPLVSTFDVPQEEFWPRAIRAFRGFVWIAEVYWELERRLQQLGFDFTYDKGFYDSLLEGRGPAIRSRLSEPDISYQNAAARFLENHDERRSAAAFGKEKLPALATLVSTLSGMRFYHQGQFEAKTLHLPIQLRRAAAEPPNEQVRALYRKLLHVAHEDTFHDGDWHLLKICSAGDPSFEELIAYEWRFSATLKIVVVNLSVNHSQGSIILDSALDSSVAYRVHDELNDKDYEWSARDLTEGRVLVRLAGYQSQILDISPKLQ